MESYWCYISAILFWIINAQQTNTSSSMFLMLLYGVGSNVHLGSRDDTKEVFDNSHIT